MDEKELSLDFNDSMKFVDLESSESILTDPRHIKFDYIKAVSSFCDNYKTECEKNKIDYIRINTSDSLEKSLIEYLIKRSKLI